MLEMFTIYCNPRDYPGKYVVRRHVTGIGPDPEPLAVVDTLDEARDAVPPYLACMNRQPDDQPQIVETWF
jgi:hypothetical protein